MEAASGCCSYCRRAEGGAPKPTGYAVPFRHCPRHNEREIERESCQDIISERGDRVSDLHRVAKCPHIVADLGNLDNRFLGSQEEYMTYYGAKELADSFRTVRKNTIQVAEDIPEDKYGFKAAEESRTVEKLFTHIALSTRFPYQIHSVEKRTSMEGFNFPALMQQLTAEEAQVRTKAEVIQLLRTEGEKWATFVEGVSDDFLGETISMPPGGTPPQRTRFDMILGAKEHEMHHRGQLMLIERMLGIVPHLTRQMQERIARAMQR
jgi:uncharacterized damage-inducible protein DinB